MGKLETIFRKFHGVDASEKLRVKVLSQPKSGAVLGRVTSFTYETMTDGSSREGDLYEHEVGDIGPGKSKAQLWLIVDKDGKPHFMWVEAEGRFPTVNERGVVG